jgi:predicted porin
MRKILLGTTALMAAGALYAADAQAADPIKASVGGFMTQRFGYASTDVNPNVANPGAFDYDGFDIKQDAEIHFLGSTKLDNGITVGIVVELEAAGIHSSSYSGAQTTSDLIDEEFLFLTGSFGRLEIGATNNAAYKMAYRHDSASGSLATNEGTIPRWIRVPANFVNADNTNPLIANDRDQITYYTPRWEGFQVGLSYIPAANEGQFIVAQPNRAGGAGSAAGNATLLDGFAAGVNYDRKFGDFGVRLSVTGETYSGREGTADGSAHNLSAGAIVTYGGFSAGVSWLTQDSRGPSSAGVVGTMAGSTISGDIDVMHVGLGYRFGATYITGTYTWGKSPGDLNSNGQNINGDDESKLWMVAVSHDIGPGVSVHGSIFGADWDNENTAARLTDTDGWGAVVGITTRF